MFATLMKKSTHLQVVPAVEDEAAAEAETAVTVEVVVAVTADAAVTKLRQSATRWHSGATSTFVEGCP